MVQFYGVTAREVVSAQGFINPRTYCMLMVASKMNSTSTLLRRRSLFICMKRKQMK